MLYSKLSETHTANQHTGVSSKHRESTIHWLPPDINPYEASGIQLDNPVYSTIITNIMINFKLSKNPTTI